MSELEAVRRVRLQPVALSAQRAIEDRAKLGVIPGVDTAQGAERSLRADGRQRAGDGAADGRLGIAEGGGERRDALGGTELRQR